MPRDTS